MRLAVEWLNYHHLLHFWSVAREGGVRAAAESLHVSPASVSLQVRQLEKALGVALLERKGRGVVLTEMGEVVAEYAREIFSTGRELVETVKGRSAGKALVLRVGVHEVTPKLVAYRLLQPALESDPSPRLVCREGDMSQLISELATHRLDVVLSDTALDPLYKVQAYSHRLGQSGVVVVGESKLARAHRKDFPRSLDGADFLLPTENSLLRRQLEQWFREQELRPVVRGEFSDSAMLKIAGSQGLGLLAVPSVIREDVDRLYGLKFVGNIVGVREQFFAVSVERTIKHPSVVAIQRASQRSG